MVGGSVLTRSSLGFALWLLLSVTGVSAESPCPLNGTSSNKLVSLVPQVYGPYGPGSGATAPLLAYERLVVSGNVLVKSNHSGLRASTVPLVGASYTF